MARCGCGGQTCSCAVTGDNTTATVTGTGTSANPYVVHALPQGQTTVLDTPEVDLTITGAGTTASPYVISADVNISTDPNNCLEDGADGALYVACPDGSETIVTPGPGVSVTGTGTVADPYVVASTAAGGTVVMSGAGTTVLGAGSGADPYIVNVDPGCGVEIVGDLVRAAVSAWPFGCPQDANAQEVYCSPTSGRLQTVPAKTVTTASVGSPATVVTNLAADCDGAFHTIAEDLGALVITNPSPCLFMLVLVDFGGRARLDVDNQLMFAGTGATNSWTLNAVQEIQTNGGGYFIAFNDTFNHESGAGNEVTAVGGSTSIPIPGFVLAPGASATFDRRIRYSCNGDTGGSNLQIVYNMPAIRATGWTV